MIDQEPDQQLARLTHERLRALPEPTAPKELIPGVFTRIAAQDVRPWWRRTWLEWPHGLQILSAALALAALAGIWFLSGDLAAWPGRAGVWLTGARHVFQPLWTLSQTVLNVIVLLVNSIKTPFLITGLAAIGLLYLSALGLGTVFYRVATVKKLNL